MGKVKFTKTELKKQQDALKQFKRFLPTLQLKKQQLQMEVRQSTDMLDANLASQRELVERMDGFLELFGSEAEVGELEQKVRVKSVRTGTANIAGIPIPTFESVEFEEIPWDIFDTDWFVDDAIRAIRLIASTMANAVVEGRQGEENTEAAPAEEAPAAE